MRIGILTFCYTVNYGAELQAYALVKTLNNRKDTVAELIDYECLAILKNNRPVNGACGKGLVDKIKKEMAQKKARERWSKFRKFEKKYIPMSKETYNSTTGIRTEMYDRIVIGSDQVWNLQLTEGDTNFFLPDVRDRNAVCSYAASFGYSQIPKEYKEITKKGIESIPNLSVREESGARIIFDLCGIKSKVVLDLTLLLKPEEWRNLLDDKEKKVRKPYILLYLINASDSEMWNFINKYAKKNNFDILWITPRRNIGKPGKKIRSAGPVDFLDLIENASLIVTGSFHAVCFSLQFSKTFLYTVKDKNKSNRVVDLLDRLGIKEAVLDAHNPMIPQLDYKTIQERLTELRKESLNVLDQIVNINKYTALDT